MSVSRKQQKKERILKIPNESVHRRLTSCTSHFYSFLLISLLFDKLISHIPDKYYAKLCYFDELKIRQNRRYRSTHSSFQNGCHLSILLFTCKLALNEATRANFQANDRILKWQPFWNKVYGQTNLKLRFSDNQSYSQTPK